MVVKAAAPVLDVKDMYLFDTLVFFYIEEFGCDLFVHGVLVRTEEQEADVFETGGSEELVHGLNSAVVETEIKEAPVELTECGELTDDICFAEFEQGFYAAETLEGRVGLGVD